MISALLWCLSGGAAAMQVAVDSHGDSEVSTGLAGLKVEHRIVDDVFHLKVHDTRGTENTTIALTTGICEAFPSNWFTDYSILSDFEAMLKGECVEFVNTCLRTLSGSWNNCNHWRRVWGSCASKFCCNAGDAEQTWQCEKEVDRQTKQGCPESDDGGQVVAQDITIGTFCGTMASWFSTNSQNVPMTEEPKDDSVVESLVAQLQQRKSVLKHEADDTDFEEALRTKCAPDE